MGELVGDIACVPADEIEIPRLPERPGMVSKSSHGVAGLEFPLVHDVRQKIHLSGEEEMRVVRHDDIAQELKIQRTTDCVEDFQD